MRAPERGAWLRRGISRDGGPLREDGYVVWLQVGDRYADSRGFAGVTSYDGTRVRFGHDVGEPGEDEGVLTQDGVNLVETGTNTDGSTFREIWTPLPDGEGPCGVWRVADCQVVRVGAHLVHVDGRGGGYLRTP
ncbi:hypothetical protein AB0K43_24960 [Kitasatospora sp. NPDC049258]|uniref:hypothetical protein n=1 Tax=Kitasatospora sp. NPDC049258 TaxID=3155394 RepID=UPI0034218C43